jgi:hypothetical protein
MAASLDDLPLIPADTVLTDRELLIHALQHIEQIHAELTAFRGLVEEFGPVLEKWRTRGSRGSRLFGSG